MLQFLADNPSLSWKSLALLLLFSVPVWDNLVTLVLAMSLDLSHLACCRLFLSKAVSLPFGKQQGSYILYQPISPPPSRPGLGWLLDSWRLHSVPYLFAHNAIPASLSAVFLRVLNLSPTLQPYDRATGCSRAPVLNWEARWVFLAVLVSGFSGAGFLWP